MAARLLKLLLSYDSHSPEASLWVGPLPSRLQTVVQLAGCQQPGAGRARATPQQHAMPDKCRVRPAPAAWTRDDAAVRSRRFTSECCGRAQQRTAASVACYVCPCSSKAREPLGPAVRRGCSAGNGVPAEPQVLAGAAAERHADWQPARLRHCLGLLLAAQQARSLTRQLRRSCAAG